MWYEIIVFDGFDELDAVTLYEVLPRTPMLDVVDLETRLVAVGGPGEVTAAYGLRVLTQDGPSEVPNLLLVTGRGLIRARWCTRGSLLDIP